MKGLIFAVAAALVVALASAAEGGSFCYGDVNMKCSSSADEAVAIPNCNAAYGGAASAMEQLSNYVNTHITRSFQYLLMSTHFGSYEANRPGFEKLYRVLSDQNWEASLDLIKHMTKRGGKMNFNYREADNLANVPAKKEVYELHELGSLARALDIQKSLAEEAFHIHHTCSAKDSKHHDAELTHYLEEHFIEKHADTIRNLAGHTSDLKNLLKTSDASLSMYLFDEYLFNKLSG